MMHLFACADIVVTLCYATMVHLKSDLRMEGDRHQKFDYSCIYLCVRHSVCFVAVWFIPAPSGQVIY